MFSQQYYLAHHLSLWNKTWNKAMSQAMELASSSRTRNIFNDHLGTSPLLFKEGHTTFPQFSQLLPELRLYIWKLCIPPRRVISLRISQPRIPRGEAVMDNDHDGTDAPDSYYTTRNDLGNIVSTYPYRVHVPRFNQWFRALEHVNRESRHEVCSLYRLVMPINQATNNTRVMLRLSPDTDILELQLDQRQLTPAAALVAFFHDALAYDPVGRGLANIALGRDMNDIMLLARLTSLTKSEGRQDTPASRHDVPVHPVAVASIREWLQTGLRTFYSVVSPHIEARLMLGYFSWPSEGHNFHLNRSVPIAAQGAQAQVTEYSSFGPDPRNLGELDLAHAAVDIDPRRTTYFWHRILDNLGLYDLVMPDSTMQTRYLMAIWPSHWDAAPVSREGFAKFLEDGDEKFAKHMRDFKLPTWGNRIDEETWRKEKETLSDVAGLWIFDAGTFGPIPSLDESVDRFLWTPKMVKDLTTTRPELLVSHLG